MQKCSAIKVGDINIYLVLPLFITVTGLLKSQEIFSTRPNVIFCPNNDWFTYLLLNKVMFYQLTTYSLVGIYVRFISTKYNPKMAYSTGNWNQYSRLAATLSAQLEIRYSLYLFATLHKCNGNSMLVLDFGTKPICLDLKSRGIKLFRKVSLLLVPWK